MGATKYNGVILPDLPDYDRNTYPYALICKTVYTDGNYGYVLLVCSEALTQDRYYGDTYNYSTNAKIAGYSVVDTGSTYRWSLGQIQHEYGDTLQYCFRGEYVWSNYDVCLRNDPVPILPTWNSAQYPYLIIVNHDRESADEIWRNDYFAYYSAEPFTAMKYPDGYGAVEGYETTNGAAYFSNTETLGRQEFDQEWISEYIYTTEGWKIPYDGEFDDYLPNTLIGTASVLTENGAHWSNVWANHDIYDTVGIEKIHEANSWYNLVVYTEGTTEDVTVYAPTNVVAEGGGTYNQYDTAYALNCTADTPEGGFLSYKWYRNGAVCGYTATLFPSTGTAGTFEYYCVVTNTQYGEKVSAKSATLTVVVNAVDLPDDPEVDPEAEQKIIEARKRKHAIGYVLHQCGVPMAEMIAEMLANPRTPIAYSYNGIVLPDINTVYTETLQATHPYVLYFENSYRKRLYLLKTYEFWYGIDFGLTYDQRVVDTSFQDELAYDFENGEWVYYDIPATDADFFTFDYIKWANFPLINENGSVYLPVSDPVPVYE